MDLERIQARFDDILKVHTGTIFVYTLCRLHLLFLCLKYMYRGMRKWVNNEAPHWFYNSAAWSHIPRRVFFVLCSIFTIKTINFYYYIHLFFLSFSFLFCFVPSWRWNLNSPSFFVSLFDEIVANYLFDARWKYTLCILMFQFILTWGTCSSWICMSTHINSVRMKERKKERKNK